jgi:hypothetical protein
MSRLLPAPEPVIRPQPSYCPACGANLGTPAGITKHNIHAAADGERSYPLPTRTYVR